jgi:hypothetical protein
MPMIRMDDITAEAPELTHAQVAFDVVTGLRLAGLRYVGQSAAALVLEAAGLIAARTAAELLAELRAERMLWPANFRRVTDFSRAKEDDQ